MEKWKIYLIFFNQYIENWKIDLIFFNINFEKPWSQKVLLLAIHGFLIGPNIHSPLVNGTVLCFIK